MYLIYTKLEDRESSEFLADIITDMFIEKLEEIKEDMKGCTGEDCQYPLDKAIKELK